MGNALSMTADAFYQCDLNDFLKYMLNDLHLQYVIFVYFKPYVQTNI